MCSIAEIAKSKKPFIPSDKVCPVTTPIAVTKQDIMRIFDPTTNQKLNAWQMDYRRFHDMWILENKLDSIYLSIQEAKA